MSIKELEAVIEAILFTMGEAVEVERIAAAVEHDEDTIRRLIRNMMTRYEEEDRGIRIIELDGSFQLCTKPEMYEYLIKVAHVPKKHVLTDVMLETLSIIAYKQPGCAGTPDPVCHDGRVPALFWDRIAGRTADPQSGNHR